MDREQRESLVAFFGCAVDQMIKANDFSSVDFACMRDDQGGLVVDVVIDGESSKHLISEEYLSLSEKAGLDVFSGNTPDSEVVNRLELMIEKGELRDHGKAN
jgi:hypothetical protein